MRSPVVGYWISGTGKLSGAYYTPSFWERFCRALFSDESWTTFR